MAIRPDLKDWKFWFAIIGAVCTAFGIYNKIDTRLTSVEIKMDMIIDRIDKVAPYDTAKMSDEEIWPWEEWEDDIQTAGQ